jgi:tetratricopeptide (TPR) repeat protein
MLDFESPRTHLIIIGILAFAVFANSLSGEFVYDDKRQILMNALIQEPSNYGRALTVDVWAFLGDGSVAASNYYRPTFVSWLILNFALFGGEAFGWHLLNVLLHVAVSLSAYGLLMSMKLAATEAFAVSAIFAVHPVHTESVAWISGSPDLLFSLFFLGSLWFAVSARQIKGISKQLIASIVLYVLALGAKEIGILCLPIYFLVFRENAAGKRRPVTSRLVPYAVAAIVYLIVRYRVIGGFSHLTEDMVSAGEALLSLPAVFAFYVRQMLIPFSLSANHPLRPIAGIDLFGFVIPLVISSLVLAGLWLASRRHSVRMIGAAIFLLTLAPALNLTAFPAEQIVHDRYLYLPLLGFLMVAVPAVSDQLGKLSPSYWRIIGRMAMILIVAILGIKTFTYNRVWASDVSLWRQAVIADPGSAFTWSQLGSALSVEGDRAGSIDAFRRSLANGPTPLAQLGQAKNFLDTADHEKAIELARNVIGTANQNINAYTLFRAYELEAVALTQTNRAQEAERSLRSARTRLPIYSAAVTEKIAVALYQQSRKTEALRELEAARDQARRELLPASKMVFFRLGMLQAELGNNQAAANYFREYLQYTAKATDAQVVIERRRASEMLGRLSGAK